MRTTTVGALVASLVTSLGTALALGGGAATADAAVSPDVRVGSFNVTAVTFDPQATADRRPWRERRAAVAGQILSERLDVVGVQEANPSGIYKDRLVNGANQYMDLKNALNERGGNYALTNEFAYNCVRSTSSTKCAFQDRGAALDNRILYDADTVSMVRQGSYRFATQTAGKYERYLAWAVLKMKATGRQFLFTNTHLDPYSNSTKVAQWKQAITQTNALRGTLPVIAVGDYNTTKFSTWAKQMLPATKAAGYGDVLNQEFQVNPTRVKRAALTTNAYLNSYNNFNRSVTWCYCTRKDKYGNNIDWIFATNTLKVKEWEVVADFDPVTMKLRGVIPSDHNLVRATIAIP